MDPYEAVNSCKVFHEKNTGYIEEESPQHYCYWDPLYPENPARVACCKKRLAALKLRERCEIVTPEHFPEEVYLKNHDAELFEELKSISNIAVDQLEKKSSEYDSVYFTQETFECSIRAAEAALTLTLKVAKGELKNGLALIRPPGHHAMSDAFCGYCFLNNVAVSAQAAIDQGLAKKVLIVDHDVHHGQGTQRMFYDRNDVLYFSIHRYEHGEFWPNLRESDSDYIGEGPGRGYNINVPLNVTGLGDSEYLATVLNILLPVAYEFDPDLILISAGFDSAIGCPEGEMLVTPHFYASLITLLSGLARGKVVVCLEGGYFPESLAEGVCNTLQALLGDACYPIDLLANPTVHPALTDVLNNLKYFLRDYWECFKTDIKFEYPKRTELVARMKLEEGEHLTCLSYKFHQLQNMVEFETTGFYPIPSEEQYRKNMDIVDSLRNDYANGRKYQTDIGYVYDEQLLKHSPTHETAKSPPEKPERLLEIMKCFETFGLLERCKKIELSKFKEAEWIKSTHDEGYSNSLSTQKDLREKPDWFFNEATGECVLKCVSCILSLAKSIHDGSVRAGVALIRPPGHHASFDSGSGFCFVNNVVIAAEYLIKQENYKRVLIVDFDIHHGDGTQNLTYNRSDIMYISVHRYDEGKFFPSSNKADYSHTGEGQGKGYNVNIPFNKGNKSDTDYWNVWLKLVLPLAFSYNPDFVIVSAGFDGGYFDPLGGGYKLTPEIFGHFVHTLKPLASGKILLALEGGYHLETTALSMTMCLKALLGDPLPVPRVCSKIGYDTIETIQNVLRIHRNKWKLLDVNKKIADFTCMDEEKEKLEAMVEDESGFNDIMNKIAERTKKVT
ncbi:unnamed protein product [Phaedon cochleariae]|uniref:Histone deacetylase domain-containing protein n=1 Tax=Phaedon cochleariae TaxID=80249 RepID=A0A9P0GQV8_PHACE|nr:unnamed protein product [Phaedon cochleariae]